MASASAGSPKGNSTFNIGTFLADWGALLAIVVLVVLFTVLAGSVFASFSNLITILRSISITTVIAMGVTFGFSVNVFDLSFATLATLAASVGVTAIAWYGLPLSVAILLALLVSCLVGLANSAIVIKGNVPAFLATLSMQFILSGAILTYSGGSMINPNMGPNNTPAVGVVPDAFWAIGDAPWIIVIMVVSVVAVEVFQRYTKFGRMLYMVGSNPEAARLSGVKTNRYRTFAFIMTAVFSAVAGLLMAARAGNVVSTAGDSFMMPAIAAVSIGQSFAGRGKANALGTFIGAALVGVVENGLYALAFPYYAINIVKGAILVGALVMSYVNSRRSA